jgi:hypothetical protein
MNQAQTGRAILRLYQHARHLPVTPESTLLSAAIKAGRFMDFAGRIQRRGSELSAEQLAQFANFVGLDDVDLRLIALPTLKAAGILDYGVVDGHLMVDEFVGVSAPLLKQVADTWEELHPSVVERCALESIELATAAPLNESTHHAALDAIGFDHQARETAIGALRAVGMLHRETPSGADEPILYNEYVWGSGVVSIARFLESLPADERLILASLSGQAMQRPGISLASFQGVEADVLSAARKVGFLDATRVVTRSGKDSSFAFSPTLEGALPATSTDVLHDRKLFVAHILFGHRNAPYSKGRILQPLVLVRKLLREGEVGPATAINSDYPLLESHGIVKVKQSGLSGRAFLTLVKRDVVEDSLSLLEAALGNDEGAGGVQSIDSLWLPGRFRGPEEDRRSIPMAADAQADLFRGAIMKLRDEAQQTTRGERV